MVIHCYNQSYFKLFLHSLTAGYTVNISKECAASIFRVEICSGRRCLSYFQSVIHWSHFTQIPPSCLMTSLREANIPCSASHSTLPTQFNKCTFLHAPCLRSISLTTLSRFLKWFWHNNFNQNFELISWFTNIIYTTSLPNHHRFKCPNKMR